MFCACPDFPVLFSYYSSTKCSTSTMATRRDPDRKWWHVHAQPVPALFSYYSSVQNVFEKIRENVLRMPEFFPYFFFGFTRFFLIIVVVQTFFEKIRENVLRMAAFFPVLFLLPFFGFPRFFLTIIIVQKTWLPEVTEGVSLGRVCACTTGSCAISARLGSFTANDVIKRHMTPNGFPWKCDVPTGVVQYPPYSGIFTGSVPWGVLWDVRVL